MAKENKKLTIKRSGDASSVDANVKPWDILVIDDDQGVLEVTCNVLRKFKFKGRGLSIHCATSLEEAKVLYADYPNSAVALVDCAMEKDTAGLDFIEYIRGEEDNPLIQLVLRTGQPGFAPEQEMLLKYDINDYLAKTELTSARLKHRMISYLRAYEGILTIAEQNQQLKQLSVIKDNLLSVVSHELKSPLSAIEGLVNIVFSRLTKVNTVSAEDSRRLAMIDGCINRMKLLINDLVDSAMIRRNEFRINPTNVDVTSLVDELIPIIETQMQHIGREDVAFVNQVDIPQLSLHIDKERIQQVIINLVNNALKFTLEGSITLQSCIENAYLSISVVDTGIGINEEDLSHIFDMFSQVQSSRKLSCDGIGLGLSIANKIVAAHNGKIFVSSTPGVGSSFTFTLPLKQIEP